MSTRHLTHLEIARQELAAGALFVVNHSGGKDSQAMLIRVAAVVPAPQLIVVHASLGDVEWPGALELARDQAKGIGVPFIVARATKTFLEMVDRRFAARPHLPAFPLASQRQCTADLKRDPIMREVRRIARDRGVTRIVTCMGLRAAESASRAKAKTWGRSTRGSVAGREWFEWLPIHHLSTEEVFATIREAGQSPHWAYAAGNERLSCLFCIMGSAGDARNAAIHAPDMFAAYVERERRTGYTLHQSRKPLEVVAGLTVEEARTENRRLPIVLGGASS
jgi:3'-phosphoadenosine 5'-phosphosulfate sulfotransferase (PAPS reductase)/FAD synthetase